MFCWLDLTTGEMSQHGYDTKGLVMQTIQHLQSQDHHAYRCILKGPAVSEKTGKR